MKSLATRNNNGDEIHEDAVSLVLSTIPVVMGAFKREMRANRPAGLSVPQFRTLLFINKASSVSISDVAEHLGLAISTASKLVDGLVKREFVQRITAAEDRRRMVVTLTESGKSALDMTRKEAHAHVREHLSVLTPEEEQAVTVAMKALHKIFRPSPAE